MVAAPPMELAMATLDFGSPSPRPQPWGRIVLAGAIGLSLAVAAFVPRLQRDRAEAIAQWRAWTIEGPPCPSLGPVEAARWPYQAKKTFGYAGAGFGFAIGHAACSEIHANNGTDRFRGYPVCQFTSPAVISVEAGHVRAFFTPGLGQRATVTVKDGVITCVMAGDFYGQNNF
jgi:hypothetical protein